MAGSPDKSQEGITIFFLRFQSTKAELKLSFYFFFFLNLGNVDNVAQVVVVLVTGGCGYVGTHTVLQLLEQNVHVVVVDNLAGVTRGIYLKI